MTLLNENPHPCVAFRNYMEFMYLINMFLKFLTLWGVKVNNNYYYRFVFDKQHYGKSKEYFDFRKMQVPFSVPIGNEETQETHEHLCMGTVRLK